MLTATLIQPNETQLPCAPRRSRPSKSRAGGRRLTALGRLALAALLATGCGDDGDDTTVESAPSAPSDPSDPGAAAAPLDPAMAPRALIDRFSEDAATLQVRTDDNGLPDPGEPIDLDQPPFITRGLGPEGQSALYYNFDVQPAEPAPIYVLFREGEDSPVSGQLNIIDVIPGDPGYNDYWRVHRVVVDADYVANSLTSLEGIMSAGLAPEATETLVNCPVVPEGSTANRSFAGGPSQLTQGWYRGQIAPYFSFNEHPLSGASVDAAPIFVTFNINPGEDGGGPPSGFVTEADSDQTHNVLTALPGADDYSPLWSVNPYDNADFDSVTDLATAEAANVLATGVALVNCPVVGVED